MFIRDTSRQADYDIPSRFPATPMDKMNYLTCEFADQQINCVIAFDRQIDAFRMAIVLRMVMDAEPVLGCRFVARPLCLYWKRRNDLEDLDICPVVETSNPKESLLRFAAVPADQRKDPLVQGCVFRSSKDTLCIKVSHVAADAAGVKQIVYRIAGFYNRLGYDPAYSEVPNLCGNRNQMELLGQFGFMEKYRVFRNRPAMRPYWGFPMNGSEDTLWGLRL